MNIRILEAALWLPFLLIGQTANLMAQASSVDSTAILAFQTEQKELSGSVSRHIYSDYVAFYTQPVDTFLLQIDSLHALYTELLDRHATGLPSALVADDSLGTVYYFDRLILEYPGIHFELTGETIPLNQQVSGRLRAHATDFDHFAKLDNRDFRDYVGSFLRLEKDRIAESDAYPDSDNRWLRIYWDLIDRWFANPRVQAYWKRHYLLDHLENYGIKNIEPFYEGFLRDYPDVNGRQDVIDLYESQRAGRQGHRIENYKLVDGFELDMHLFLPDGVTSEEDPPIVVYFHGGSWTQGKPDYFFEQGRQFAQRGWAGASVEYRIGGRHGSTPFDAVEDAKDAIKWLREHASRLGIDPNRVLITGNSSGGHLALTTALTDQDPTSGQSAVPNALVVIAGVYDLTVDNANWIQRSAPAGKRVEDISPLHLLAGELPPTLLIHGSEDRNCPYATATAFAKVAAMQHLPIRLHTVEGGEHFIWFGQHGEETGRARAEFVKKLGWQ